MRLFGFIYLGVFMLCLGCSQQQGGEANFRLSTDGGDLQAVPQVLRVSLEGLHEVPSSDIWLIRGELSSPSQNKLRTYEIPETVANKRVPLTSWFDGERRVFAATNLLDLGERYSLIAIGYGLLGELRVDELAEPVLSRVGSGAVPPNGFVAYCVGTGPRRDFGVDDLMLPGDEEFFGVGLGLAAGVAEEHCVRIPVRAQFDGIFVPPARAAGALLAPDPVRVGTVDPDTRELALGGSVVCENELPMGGDYGCSGASDSVLKLSLRAKLALIVLEGPVTGGGPSVLRRVLLQSEAENIQSLGPLVPETEYRLRIFEFSEASLSAGMVHRVEELVFQSAAPAARWVINEVFADPQGAEPQGEWIEVVNAGAAAGSLFGLELWDSSGGVPLPDVSLDAGQYGLLVRPDFDFSEDHVPASGAIPIVVASLGQNGLKNSGERVELKDHSGNVVSSFPAKPGGVGQSVGRLNLWSSDDDATQFVLHGAPGNSPGAENVFVP